MKDRPELLNIRAQKILKELDGLSVREAEFILRCISDNLKYCSRIHSQKASLNLSNSEIDQKWSPQELSSLRL